MNADATGYENIKLIANLYNWPSDKYQELVREIEDFTELGVYLSLPTRIYSAGMQARLSFALATAQNSGHSCWSTKASAPATRNSRRRRRRACSNSSAVPGFCCSPRIRPTLCRAMCNKALVLSKGEAVFFGDIEEGFQVYASLT